MFTSLRRYAGSGGRMRKAPYAFIMSWVDALVFALVAVYFINLFFFQNYVIPSSSLEKSLLTGDYLFVSKVSYGPRIPQTPLTMPLTQHTMPLVNVKSYVEWPHWDYRRVKGLGNVKLNDIVVFNFPAGDTLVNEERYQANRLLSDGLSFRRTDSGAERPGKDVRVLHPLQQLPLLRAGVCYRTQLHRAVCRASMATSSAVLPTAARTT